MHCSVLVEEVACGVAGEVLALAVPSVMISKLVLTNQVTNVTMILAIVKQ